MKRLTNITLLAALGLALGACSSGRVQPHPPKAAENDPRPIGSLDQLPDVPTKPDGGVDLKRKVPLSPEENMARVRRNGAFPVVFGSGAGGITLNTTLAESLDILSDPYGSNESTLYYREGVIVPWSASAPEKPRAIYAIEGYTGLLDVPEAFGEVVVGRGAGAIVADGSGRAFLEAMGRHVLKKDASYNCLNDKLCKAKIECAPGTDDVTSVTLSFPGGIIAIANDDEVTIDMAVVLPLPDARMPALKEVIDLTKGTTSAALAMTRAEIEAKLKPVSAAGANPAFYDNENIVIEYKEDKPGFIQFQEDYEGALKLTTKLSAVAMGTRMAEHFATDNGEALIKDIARMVEGKPDTYDCITEKTCQVVPSGELNLLVVKGAIIGIESGCERKLMIVRVQAP